MEGRKDLERNEEGCRRKEGRMWKEGKRGRYEGRKEGRRYIEGRMDMKEGRVKGGADYLP
jgi:hypothetical protein